MKKAERIDADDYTIDRLVYESLPGYFVSALLYLPKKRDGAIPGHLTVDHMCKQRNCLEVAHLRLLTQADNANDLGERRTAPDAERLCSRGHHMSLLHSGRAYCRECNNRRARAAP